MCMSAYVHVNVCMLLRQGSVIYTHLGMYIVVAEEVLDTLTFVVNL